MNSNMSENFSVKPEKSLRSYLINVLNPVYLSDNSSTETDNYERNENKSACWVIHPDSHARYGYLIFMVVLSFVNLITIPLDMAFSEEMHGVIHTFWLSFNVFSDIIFCLDIAVNFQTGFYSTDLEVLILNPGMIRTDYLKTWFVPDVLAAFPADVIILIVHYYIDTSHITASKLSRLVMFLRIASMIRQLRLGRLVRYCFQLESLSSYQRSFRWVCAVLVGILLWHWNGCVQYFIPVLEEFPPDCWVRRQNLTNASVEEKYFSSVVRAFYHMTQTSYGSPDPLTRTWEHCSIVFSMIIGQAIVVGLIVFLLATFCTQGNTMYKKKLHELESCSFYRKLPRATRQQINAHLKNRCDRQKLRDTEEEFPDLLNVLRSTADKELLKDLQ